jgi:hypothetical protein
LPRAGNSPRWLRLTIFRLSGPCEPSAMPDCACPKDFRCRVRRHSRRSLSERLTTVRQPLNQMGEIAAEQLLTRIMNGTKSGAQQVSVEPELVVRESTCECSLNGTGKIAHGIQRHGS